MQTASQPLTRTRRSTRVRILDATAQLVREQGIRATTVKDVLDGASICRRTFYQYFKSKEDVVDALYQETATNRLVQQVADAIAEANDPVSKVLDAIDAYLEFERTGGELLVALQAEGVRRESALAATREKTLDALVETMNGAVAQEIGVTLDPLVFRTLLMGIEALVVDVQSDGPFDDAQLRRVRSVLRPMVMGILSAIPHLPRDPHLTP